MGNKTETVAIADLMAESGVAFGTSGARGLADAMTDRICYAYTVGFLQFLERAGQIRPGEAVAVAGDYRSSTPRIMAAGCRAASDLGYRPVNCGTVPTPALAAYAMAEAAAGLMVTGSHIPDDRNGIKFYKPSGEVLKQDEAGIRSQQVELPAALFGPDCSFVETPALPAVDSAAHRRYVARYLDFFPAGCLEGVRVLLYEHSSVAREALQEILSGLGAAVTCRARSEVFVPVDTEAIREADVALARQWAAADGFDAIVSTDGDGDRPLIGDETGEWFRGDLAGILTARFLDADRVVTPVSSNTALERSGWFDATERTRIGSPYVIAAMTEAEAAGGRRVVGFEANGGFLTASAIERDGRVLPALPTRDATIVALAVLLAARQHGLRLSELRATLPQRFTASNRLAHFPTDIAAERLAGLAGGGDDAVVAAFPGLGRVVSLDGTDGLRCTFENQEIVHLRPSGNAPELRCYVEAASPGRADRLLRDCLGQLESWRA